MLSLQLFLTFAAMPFMALAALAEDRKVASKELALSSERVRESEERLRLATQAGKMYAYEWDVASDLIIRSEESVNVLGFSDDGKPITRRQLSARVHPDDRVLFNSSGDQVTRENPTNHISYRMLRPDGSVVWLEKRARAFFDERGKLQRMIGMVSDITERKRTEEALLEVNHTLQAQTGLLQSREELLKIFVKSVPAQVAMLDREMRYLQVSAAGVQITSSIVRRCLDVRITSFFPTFPRAGKKRIPVLLREKHCEPTKTAGIVTVALRGFAGRFFPGGHPAGS